MSTSTFIVVLAAGGLAIGALCGMLLPRKRTGGLPMAMLMGALLTAFAGFWITEFFDTDQEVGFVALALGPLWAFTGSGGGHGGHGSSHGDHSDATWGDSDSGGGDGGGGGD